jgi:hypothetical protein
MTANNLQISAGSGPFATHRLRRQFLAARRELIALDREAV